MSSKIIITAAFQVSVAYLQFHNESEGEYALLSNKLASLPVRKDQTYNYNSIYTPCECAASVSLCNCRYDA